MAPPNQKWQSPMLPSFDDCLHAKNLRYQLIPSRNIDDQRILQSDCPDERNTWPQPKVLPSTDKHLHAKKTKINSINSPLRY